MASRSSSTPHGVPAWLMWGAGLLVFLSLSLQHGFPLEPQTRRWLTLLDGALACCFVADLVLALLRDMNWRRVLALRRFEYALLVALTGFVVVSWFPMPGVLALLEVQSEEALRLIAVRLFLLMALGIQLLRGAQQLLEKEARPELILAGAFGALILLGTFLLSLPNASAESTEKISGFDAFFTATSAVCVTGMVVRDPGTDFSGFGQLVIMALFQAGGLGIITFVGFLSISTARALPVPQMVVFRQLIHAPQMSDLKRQFVGILVATAVFELSGALLMYQFLPASMDTLARIKWSLFHSVSAFCNSGFALQKDSLEQYRSNPGLILTFMGLIMLGGLGFLVISELLAYPLTRGRFFRRFALFRRLYSGHAPGRLSVQARLTLTVTGVLLVAALAGFWALESGDALRGRPFKEAFLTSAFHAVAPRTAGFHTVPIESLQNATIVMLVVLMTIGAGPVSTGGGIKTVSFAILLLALRALVVRRDRVEVFGRSIPARSLFAALSVFVLFVLASAFGTFLLCLFDPQMPLEDQAFEVISALTTVGFSTEVTAELSPASQLVLCAAMFVGRVGPISLMLSVFHSRRQVTYELPEEEVVVG